MIDCRKVGQYISENNLWDKSLRDLNQLEIRRLAEAFFEALESEPTAGWQPPYIDQNGILIIPYCAPPKYRSWQGGQSVLKTLEELEASEEIRAKYMPTGYGQGIKKDD